MRFEAADWDDAVVALKEAPSLTLACHVNPDGDALGGLLAMALGLKQLGKKVYPSWGAPKLDLPPSYAFLPGADLLVEPGDLPSDGAFVALDCGAAHRLGSLEKRAKGAAVSFNIDHHPG